MWNIFNDFYGIFLFHIFPVSRIFSQWKLMTHIFNKIKIYKKSIFPFWLTLNCEIKLYIFYFYSHIYFTHVRAHVVKALAEAIEICCFPFRKKGENMWCGVNWKTMHVNVNVNVVFPTLAASAVGSTWMVFCG